MKIDTFWLLVTSLLLTIGCQQESNNRGDTQTRPKTLVHEKSLSHNALPLPKVPHVSTQHPKEMPGSLGISMTDGKIIIDTTQTRKFFHTIEKKMQKSLATIERHLRKERISSPDETGVVITDTVLKIDLNKSRSFMEKWMHSMESVVKELNSTMREIEKSLPRR